MKYYRPWQNPSRISEAPRPQIQIPLTPPDWYLEKLEREKKEEDKTTSYEVDYTIRDNDQCIIIKDI